MKKIKFTEIFSAIFSLLFLAVFFAFPERILSGAESGLLVCGNIIIPSLLPFMILSAFFVKSGLASRENKFLRFFSEKIFRLPPSSLPVIFMSLVGGFPVGIRMINELYDSKKINHNEAQRMALFCMNPGPAFVINAVGVSMLGSKKAGIIIFISLSLSSVLTGIFSRVFAKGKTIRCEKNHERIKLSDALVKSVSTSANGIISICAWVILVSAFMSLADEIQSEIIGNSIKAFSEVTTGCMIFSKNFPAYILAFLIGFGGLCVHCQILPQLNNMRINYFVFFSGRIISGISGAIICKILFKIFPCELQVFSSFSEVTSGGFSVSIPAVCSLFFMCVLLILDLSLDRSKKIC